MKHLIISTQVLAKIIEKHKVSRREVEQCFQNKLGVYLEDERPAHHTDPATLWFIALTNRGRMLKVSFMYIDGNVHLKSAYEPEPEAIAIYDEHGR